MIRESQKTCCQIELVANMIVNMVSLVVRMSYFSEEAVSYIKYPIVHIVLVARVHCCNKVVLKRPCCECVVAFLSQVKLQNITVSGVILHFHIHIHVK